MKGAGKLYENIPKAKKQKEHHKGVLTTGKFVLLTYSPDRILLFMDFQARDPQRAVAGRNRIVKAFFYDIKNFFKICHIFY